MLLAGLEFQVIRINLNAVVGENGVDDPVRLEIKDIDKGGLSPGIPDPKDQGIFVREGQGAMAELSRDRQGIKLAIDVGDQSHFHPGIPVCQLQLLKEFVLGKLSDLLPKL